MDRNVVEFTDLLRSHGIRVSLAEHLDAFRALEVVGLGDPEGVRDALRATMVKRESDAAAFEDLFDLHFYGAGRLARQGTEDLMREMQLSGADLEDLLAALAEALAALGVELSDTARALLAGDAGRLHLRLAEALGAGEIARPFDEERHIHAAAQKLGVASVEAELDALLRALERADLEPGLAGALRELLQRRRREIGELVRRTVRLAVDAHDPDARARRQLSELREKSFYYLSEEEIRRMQNAVTRLAQRLKDAVTVRRRRARRGKLDVKATMRSNLQCGGVPFRLRFSRRPVEKPQVVVLCDVSDSVRNVARFMLQFVYSLQDLYSKVRSFVFVSETAEATRLFADCTIGEAIDRALKGAVVNVFAHSDFGRAFSDFYRRHLDALNRKTTVIVLGDARSNYNAPQEWVLEEMRRRAKRVIWLNPENRLTWGLGDSEMDRYLPHCDVAEECRNLRQLCNAIDIIVQ